MPRRSRVSTRRSTGLATVAAHRTGASALARSPRTSTACPCPSPRARRTRTMTDRGGRPGGGRTTAAGPGGIRCRMRGRRPIRCAAMRRGPKAGSSVSGPVSSGGSVASAIPRPPGSSWRRPAEPWRHSPGSRWRSCASIVSAIRPAPWRRASLRHGSRSASGASAGHSSASRPGSRAGSAGSGADSRALRPPRQRVGGPPRARARRRDPGLRPRATRPRQRT